MQFFHWLGAEAEDVAIHYITTQQQLAEAVVVIDTSDIDE